MKETLLIIQMIISISLVGLVLLQTSPETSSQKTSLIRPKYTRRGMEKFTYILTFVFFFLFISLAILQLII